MMRIHRRVAGLFLSATIAASLGGVPASAGPVDPIGEIVEDIADPISDPVKEFYEEALRPTEDELVQALREVRDAVGLGDLLRELDELLDDTVLEDLLDDGD